MKNRFYFFIGFLLISCNNSKVATTKTAMSDTKKEVTTTKAIITEDVTKNAVIETVKYAETVCRTSWIIANDDVKTIKNLKKLLNDGGVKVQNIKIEGKRAAMTCMACSCKTGRVFVMEVAKSHLPKLKAMGFVK